jgi:hypothetical protein
MRLLFDNPDHEFHVNGASPWEIAIKHRLGKLALWFRRNSVVSLSIVRLFWAFGEVHRVVGQESHVGFGDCVRNAQSSAAMADAQARARSRFTSSASMNA